MFSLKTVWKKKLRKLFMLVLDSFLQNQIIHSIHIFIESEVFKKKKNSTFRVCNTQPVVTFTFRNYSSLNTCKTFIEYSFVFNISDSTLCTFFLTFIVSFSLIFKMAAFQLVSRGILRKTETIEWEIKIYGESKCSALWIF